MQMNDPRRRAEAESIRLQMAGQTAQNAGLSIENAFAPRRFQSEIDQRNAAAAANLAQAGLYGNQSAGVGQQNQARGMMIDTVSGAFAPQIVDPGPPPPAGAPVPPDESVFLTNPTLPGDRVDPSALPLPLFTPAGQSDADLAQLLPPLAGDRQSIAPQMPAVASTGGAFAPATANLSPDQLAVLANVAANGGAQDLLTGLGQAKGLGATTELSARQSMLGQGKAMGQGEYFMPENSNAYQANDIAGAFARAQLHEEAMNLRKSADLVAGGGGASSGASGSATSASRNPLDALGGVELTQKLSADRFGMVGENGTVISPEMRDNAMAWEASVANLTEQGIPIQTAIAVADQHHRIDSLTQVGDGWFDGDPRKQVGAGFNPASITPEESQNYGLRYAVSPGGSADTGGARMFAAGMLNPEIARMASQTAPAEAAPAQAIPPMLQRQPDVAPSTGPIAPGKAIGTAAAEKEKKQGMDRGTDYNAATLGNMIRASQAEGREISDIFATAFANTPENDFALEQVMATSKGLGVLQGGGVRASDVRNALLDARALERANISPELIRQYSAGQKQTGQQTVRRYNPATGQIE